MSKSITAKTTVQELLAIVSEHLTKNNISAVLTGGTTQSVHGVMVRMLSPTQSVMDRLAAFIGWDDAQGLDQAVWICEQQPVDFEKVKKWAKAEGASGDQTKRIESRCKSAIKKYLETK